SVNLRLDAKNAANQPRSFLHADQTESGAPLLARLEPVAQIPNAQEKTALLPGQIYAHVGLPSMFGDVTQRFLRDSVQGGSHLERYFRRYAAGGECGRHIFAAAEFLH